MNLVTRAKGILINPRQEWVVIDTEPLDLSELLIKYVLPLAAIGPIAMFIGWTAFGMGGLFRIPIGTALGLAITAYVTAVISVFVVAWITNALAPSFGAQRSMPQAIKLVAYCSTASWVAGIFQIIPALAIVVMIGGLYGLYLLYLGVPVMMKAPPDKATVYIVVIIVATIAVFFVAAALGRAVM